MRRMYSEQELSKIIKEVFNAEVADGIFDETISDAVDAYLVEHPVDITALEGQDVEMNNLELTGELSGDKVKKYFDGTFNSVWLNGCTLVNYFVKAFLNCGELQFIANFRIKNETESEISIASDGQFASFTAVPSYLKAKIYAHNGNTCESGSQGSIACCALLISETGGSMNTNNPKYANLYSSSGNIFMYNEGGAIAVPAGKSLDFEARISLAV